MSRTPKFEDVLAQMRGHYLQRATIEFDTEVESHGSPIEQVLVGTMLANLWDSTLLWGALHIPISGALEAAGLEDSRDFEHERSYSYLGCDTVFCFTQHWIQLDSRRVRPDFAFVVSGEDLTKIVVELDGHDFHERTAEQAQRDKSRDRELQAKGWSVMRFTGVEILRRPYECLMEIQQLLFARRAMRMAREREEASK